MKIKRKLIFHSKTLDFGDNSVNWAAWVREGFPKDEPGG